MPTLAQDAQVLAKHIDLLNDAVSKKASNIQEGVDILVKIVDRMAGQNNEYCNVGKTDVKEVTDTPLKVPTVDDTSLKVKGLDKLAFDTHQANESLAQDVIAKAEQTTGRIAALEQEGRKFNASRARMDVLEVTTKVRGILAADLTANWVGDDLQKLSGRMNQLHGLFVKQADSKDAYVEFSSSHEDKDPAAFKKELNKYKGAVAVAYLLEWMKARSVNARELLSFLK